MSIQEYLEEMKKIQAQLLSFIENEEENEENFQNLITLINDYQIFSDKDKSILFLNLIFAISSNHEQCPHFLDKIEKVLQSFSNDINQNFTKKQIFNNIPKNNEIIQYELDNLFDSESKNTINIENKGQNDKEVYRLIRNDSIGDFITYINKENLELNSIIDPSNFETNEYLLKFHNISFIEYAAFYGSIQNFKYLYLNKIELISSLWIFAIHGNNPEIISILEENSIEPKDKTYLKCFKEAIKCHHNEMANYIQMNHLQNDIKIPLKAILKSYNFDFLNENLINESPLGFLLEYNYNYFVKFLIQNKDINVNEYILIIYFFISFIFIMF